MANPRYREFDKAKGDGKPPPDPKGVRPAQSLNMKPMFPSASLPGKPGPDRSLGFRKAKIHPKSEGL